MKIKEIYYRFNAYWYLVYEQEHYDTHIVFS